MELKPFIRSAQVRFDARWVAEKGGLVEIAFLSPSHEVRPCRWLIGGGGIDVQLHEEMDTVLLACVDTALEKTFGVQGVLF